MTLNEIFRKIGGGGNFYTPIAVVGETVHQNIGAVIINPPLGEYIEPSHRVEHKNWKKSFRLFGVYFTLSSCRVKLRLCNHNRSLKFQQDCKQIKAKMYEKQDGRCPHCGKQFDIRYMELHHILPWGRFPELRHKKNNQILLCHDCHKEIHCDPYLNIRLMEAKAKEFGIELREKYKTCAVESEQECAQNDE